MERPHYDERPKSIQQLRGMESVYGDRERPYSAASYAAQYGIDMEDAEHLIKTSNSHKQVERQIVAMFKADPNLKDRALFLGEPEEPSEEAKRLADRLLSRMGLEPIYGGKA